MSSLADRITLYCREGASDKVYHAEIVKQGGGFVVNFSYGRRGGQLKAGTKTPKPVPRDRAQQIYSSLVMEKAGRGYSTQAPEGDPAPKAKARSAKAKARSAKAAKPKEPSWEHPELGRFKYDGTAWVRAVVFAAFKVFRYGGRTSGKCELAFDADGEADFPTPAMVAVAAAVLDRQDELPAKVTRALWDDFNGRGPDSGMYWHGDLDAVAEGIDSDDDDDDDPKPPGGPDELLRLMALNGVTVHKRVYRYDKPVVELSFAAAFEEEHGVGILTDGRTILGIGYSSDVTPFKRPRSGARGG